MKRIDLERTWIQAYELTGDTVDEKLKLLSDCPADVLASQIFDDSLEPGMEDFYDDDFLAEIEKIRDLEIEPDDSDVHISLEEYLNIIDGGTNVNEKIVLDGRLGFSLDVSRDELNILVGDDRAAARELLVKLVQSEQCHIVGDTYFPVEWNEDVVDYDMEDKLSFNMPEISVGNPNKIEVDLGYATLVAEKNADPNFKEVFVGLNDKDGGFLQDLVVVGGAYHIDDLNVVQDKGVSVKVYSDKDNEDYTHEFSVDIYEPEQEKSVDELIGNATERSVDGGSGVSGKDEIEKE